jgi:hypothetical protein
MVKDNYGDPQFQVKNYLYKEEIKILTNQDIFDSLTKTMEKEVQHVRASFISNESKEKPAVALAKDEGALGEYLLPVNITREGEVFSQTNAAINASNLCLLNLDIGQWAGKLRLQLVQFPAGSKLTLGLIRKDVFAKLGHVYK